MSRQHPNILVTGTPGTGKTELCKRLAVTTGFQHCNIGDTAAEHGCYDGFDSVLDCKVLDEDKVIGAIDSTMTKGKVIVDYHGSDFFEEEWFDIVFCLRTSTEILYKRLEEREYSEVKIKNNIESEIFQVLLEEARDSYDPDIVHELTSDDQGDVDSNIARITSWITSCSMNNESPSTLGIVARDHSEPHSTPVSLACWIEVDQNNPQCSVQYSVPQQNSYLIDNNNNPQMLESMQVQQVFQNNNNNNNNKDYLKCSQWPSCKFYTTNEVSLKNHELSHVPPVAPLYNCAQCNLTFAQESSLDSHMKRKHRYNFTCKTYSCSHCNFETTVLDEFSEHNVAYHLDTGSSEQIYQCTECSYSTSWKCFMDSHLLIHSINALDSFRTNKKQKVIHPIKPEVTSTSIVTSEDSEVTTRLSEVVYNKPEPIPEPIYHSEPQPLASKPEPRLVTTHAPLTAHITNSHIPHTQHSNIPHTQNSNIPHTQHSSIPHTQHSNIPHTQHSNIPHTQHSNIQSFPQHIQHSQQQSIRPQHTQPQHIAPHPQSLQQLSRPTLTQQPHNQQQSHPQQSHPQQQAHPQQQTHPQQQPHPQQTHICDACGFSSPNPQDIAHHQCYSQTFQPPQQQQQAYIPVTTQQLTTLGTYQAKPQRRQTAPEESTPQQKRQPQRYSDDFEEHMYRCRKCNYGTSWKCFLDSHMLTHVGT